MTMKKAARPKKKAASKSNNMEQMMAQWQKAMTPAEGHKRLEPIVGSFKAKATFVMEPGGEAQKSDATSEHRWILDGRFVEQEYNGTTMGMPFQGRGYTGYDNVKKKYVGTWMDSFSTGVMNFTSTKISPKQITSVAESLDPSGKKMVFDTILSIKDKNRHTYEMWTKAKNGKKFRTMLIEYTRA